MKELWEKVPVWIKAILTGFALGLPIVTINQILIQLNILVLPQFPWALLMIVLFLFLYWRFAVGKGKPFKESATRQRLSMNNLTRFRSLTWMILSIVGLIGFTASAIFIGFAFSADTMAQLQLIDMISLAPIQTAIPLLFAAALTAGIVEEIVFRGYIQTMTQDKYGVTFSFVITAIIFTVLHFLPLPLLLPYFLVSIAFSFIAYHANSIIPGIFAHIIFDIAAFLIFYFNPKMSSPEYVSGALIPLIILALISSAIIWASKNKVTTNDY